MPLVCEHDAVVDCPVGPPASMSTPKRDVFICHASADKLSLARPLNAALIARGLSVWYDEAEIGLGENIVNALQRGLASSRYVAALITPAFLEGQGHHRREELNAALSMQINRGTTVVIPIVAGVDHARLEQELPFVAARRYDSLARGVEQVADSLSAMVIEVTRPKLLARSEVDPAVGTVEARIAAAKRKLCISGNDCKFVAESLSPHIQRAVECGKDVHILCVDPESPAAEMLPLIDSRFPDAPAFRASVDSVRSTLAGISKLGKGLQLRFLPILPAVGFFLTDPGDDQGVVKVELYVSSKPNMSVHRPHIILSQHHAGWREYFIQQWDLYWALGSVVPL